MKSEVTGKEVQPITEQQAKFAKPIIKYYSKLNVWVYRVTKGRLWNKFPPGYEICLVTHTGRKSGKQITTPLIYVPDGDDLLLVASQGGMAKNPAWYYNIKANPVVELNYRGKIRKMKAYQMDDEEKARMWPHLCSIYPPYDEYQVRTERNIPVFRCQPIDG